MWTDPRSGHKYVISESGEMFDGLEPLVGWSYGVPRGPCFACGGFTRASDPSGHNLHPACAVLLEGAQQ